MSSLGLYDIICPDRQTTPSVVQRYPPFESDPARLLPELLDRLVDLGDMARQISQALGGNGHRPDKAKELLEALSKR